MEVGVIKTCSFHELFILTIQYSSVRSVKLIVAQLVHKFTEYEGLAQCSYKLSVARILYQKK
jgi:hypothetical protein